MAADAIWIAVVLVFVVGIPLVILLGLLSEDETDGPVSWSEAERIARKDTPNAAGQTDTDQNSGRADGEQSGDETVDRWGDDERWGHTETETQDRDDRW